MWSTVAVSLNSTFTMSSVRVLAVSISGFSTTRLAGVQDGSSAVDAVSKEDISKQFKELKKFGDNVAALMDLSTGRLDAVVVDEVVGRFLVNKKPENYVVLADDFGTEDYGVGFRKDDEATRNKVNDVLSEMKKDGKAAEIAQKWFGADVIKQDRKSVV